MWSSRSALVISFLKSAIHSFTRVCGKHLLCARQDLCLHSTIAFQLNCGGFNSSQSCTQNSGPLPPRAFPLLFSPACSHLDPAPTHCFAHSNTAYPCPFLAEKSLGFLEFMQSFFFHFYYVMYSMLCLIVMFLKHVDMKFSCCRFFNRFSTNALTN